MSYRSINDIKIPDLAPALNATLVQINAAQIKIKETFVDITESINGAFEQMAGGLGEFLGALATGDAGINDFAQLVIGSFADLAVTIGKLTIKSALAVAGIEKALKIPGAWPVALAAGAALVALGTAVKGAFSNLASGGASAASSVSSSSYTYDTRMSATPARVELTLNGTLKAQGKDLVMVISEENVRKNLVT
ncbi:MAG: hypothetical protein GX459_03120 [Bacteroidales bacterium]|nr:hypothetical protein [Bacteroidales bacterium]